MAILIVIYCTGIRAASLYDKMLGNLYIVAMCLVREEGDCMLRLRIQGLCESRCEDLALNILDVCIKCRENRVKSEEDASSKNPSDGTTQNKDINIPPYLTQDQNFYLDTYYLLMFRKKVKRQELQSKVSYR